jgi:predicted DNA-binding transcriptional regulator AlpA
MADQLLTQKQLAEHIGCHRNTIPRMEQRGDIPPPKISSTRRRQWLRREIESWFALSRTTSHNEQVNEVK